MPPKMWIVGRFIVETEKGIVWEFQGIFDNEEEAAKACRTRSYFIGPAVLNESLPHETMEWPGCYYPIVESESKEKSC